MKVKKSSILLSLIGFFIVISVGYSQLFGRASWYITIGLIVFYAMFIGYKNGLSYDNHIKSNQ